MVKVTDIKPLGTATYEAERYAFIYPLIMGGGNNIEAIIGTNARDDIISLACAESKNYNNPQLMFSQHESNEGYYYARLYTDTIITLEDIGADYHRVRYIRANNDEYKALYSVLDTELNKLK